MFSETQSPTTPSKDIRFHKNIDLGKLLDINRATSTGSTSMVRVPSNSSFSSGMRKSSFLSSLASPSRFKLQDSARSNPYVPQISISELIKKKAHLYHDETLAFNFDDVLQNGYNIVLQKKHQKTLLKEHEEQLREEINSLEKEVYPEMNKLFAHKEEMKYLKDMKAKYISEVEQANQDNVELESVISERRKEVEGLGDDLVRNIKQLDHSIVTMKNELTNNKNSHRQELADYREMIKTNEAKHQKQFEELNKAKQEYDKLRYGNVDRKRKMENKSKMYLGILKH